MTAYQAAWSVSMNAKYAELINWLWVVGAIVVVLLAVLLTIALWKIFQKAGYKGYESLIKGHNGYLMILISGKPGWWYFLFLIPILLLTMWISLADKWFSTVAYTMILLGMIGLIYLYAVISHGIAKKFGKWARFTVWLVILPFIFYPILGFGKVKYKK